MRRNPACQGMCSKCYREVAAKADAASAHSKQAVAALADVQRPQAQQPPSSPQPVAQPALAVPAPAPAADEQPSVSVPAEPSPATPGKPEQKNHSRCFVCNKRVGLTGFKCTCEYTFCAAHRLAEAHDCSFDYKTTQRQRLAQSNPLISAAKIQKL